MTDQPGKRKDKRIEEACPRCGMARSRWSSGGVERAGTLYCCEGCAAGTGCICGRPPPSSAENPPTSTPHSIL